VSRRVRHRERGFTLLELLITMVVTIFGLMGIMALHVSLTQGNDSASRTQEAIAVGTQSIEMLRSKRITDMANTLVGSTSATPPIDVPNFTTVLGRNNVSYTVDVHVTTVPTATNLWRVRVEVHWTDDGSLTAHTIPFEVIRTVQEAL
jgi:type IV pilus assembly protein PilV